MKYDAATSGWSIVSFPFSSRFGKQVLERDETAFERPPRPVQRRDRAAHPSLGRLQPKRRPRARGIRGDVVVRDARLVRVRRQRLRLGRGRADAERRKRFSRIRRNPSESPPSKPGPIS